LLLDKLPTSKFSVFLLEDAFKFLVLMLCFVVKGEKLVLKWVMEIVINNGFYYIIEYF